MLKEAIVRIIAVLEKDRSYIVKSFKKYDDRVNHKEKTKQEGSKIARNVLTGKRIKVENLRMRKLKVSLRLFNISKRNEKNLFLS